MDKKDVNKVYIVCNVIMAVLLVISLVITVYTSKIKAAIQQEIEQQIEMSGEIAAEIKLQVNRHEEIYGRYIETLNRNTASNEELIRILRRIDQQEEERAWKE